MTAIIILAAGASTRLGRPKQLLKYKDGTLLQHAIRQALDAKPQIVIVVLGATHEQIQESIKDCPVHTCSNPRWQEGMGASIQTGMAAMRETLPEADKVLLMLCDQPLTDGDLLLRLIATSEETNKGIVATAYDNTLGVPSLFDKKYFADLEELPAAQGAKVLIGKYGGDVGFVPAPGAMVDIDREEDYRGLVAKAG